MPSVDRVRTKIFQAPSRQPDVLRVVLGAADDARFAASRQSHGLRFVELGVLESRQSKQAIAERGRHRILRDVDLVAQDQFHGLGKRTGNGRFSASA